MEQLIISSLSDVLTLCYLAGISILLGFMVLSNDRSKGLFFGILFLAGVFTTYLLVFLRFLQPLLGEITNLFFVFSFLILILIAVQRLKLYKLPIPKIIFNSKVVIATSIISTLFMLSCSKTVYLYSKFSEGIVSAIIFILPIILVVAVVNKIYYK